MRAGRLFCGTLSRIEVRPLIAFALYMRVSSVNTRSLEAAKVGDAGSALSKTDWLIDFAAVSTSRPLAQALRPERSRKRPRIFDRPDDGSSTPQSSIWDFVRVFCRRVRQ